MSTLKLSMAASTYLRPPYEFQKWVRNIAPTTTVATASCSNNAMNSSTNYSKERISVVVGWTMMHPCPLPLTLTPYTHHHHKASALNLGFRLHHHQPNTPFFASSSSSPSYSSCSFPYSSSSEEKGATPSSSAPPMPRKMGFENDKSPPSPPPQHCQTSKFLTLPTILTLGRVAAVPLLVSTFYINSWWGTTATTSIFIAAAITDWLDGYIARKMKLGTAFGAFLDPVADKLMVAATLVLLCSRPLEVATFGQVPWLLTVPAIAIIGREITMSAVREWAASQNSKLLEAVAVNNLGKWKTATQMTALAILLAARDSNLAGPGIMLACGITLLNVSAGLAMWSLVVYTRKIWKVMLK